jgi:hypothetical protein
MTAGCVAERWYDAPDEEVLALLKRADENGLLAHGCRPVAMGCQVPGI